MDQNSIMTTAYNEYMDQMNDIMLPFLITTFDEMYDRAKVDSKGKNTLIRFQQYLRDIKSWNQGVLRDATDEVCKSCAYFRELLTAIIVGYTKILSSVRLRSEKQKVAIKLPKTEDFVYKLYEENAKVLYKDPYWMSEDLAEDDKIDRMRPVNRRCLEVVVKSLVPVQTILDAYIGNNGQATDVESQLGDDPEDTEDPEVMDQLPTNLEDESATDGPADIEGDEPVGEDPEGTEDPEDEPKNIELNNVPPEMKQDSEQQGGEAGDIPDDEDEGDLFPNLNDTRNK